MSVAVVVAKARASSAEVSSERGLVVEVVVVVVVVVLSAGGEGVFLEGFLRLPRLLRYLAISGTDEQSSGESSNRVLLFARIPAKWGTCLPGGPSRLLYTPGNN